MTQMRKVPGHAKQATQASLGSQNDPNVKIQRLRGQAVRDRFLIKTDGNEFAHYNDTDAIVRGVKNQVKRFVGIKPIGRKTFDAAIAVRAIKTATHSVRISAGLHTADLPDGPTAPFPGCEPGKWVLSKVAPVPQMVGAYVTVMGW